MRFDSALAIWLYLCLSKNPLVGQGVLGCALPFGKRDSMKIYKIVFTIAQITFLLMMSIAVLTDKKRGERNIGLYLTYATITVLDIGCLIGMWL